MGPYFFYKKKVITTRFEKTNRDYHQHKKILIIKKNRLSKRKIVNHGSKGWQKKISDYKLSMLIPLKS
jgi:hypothetical protein